MLTKPCKISSYGCDGHGYAWKWDRKLKKNQLHHRVVLEKKLGRPIKPTLQALHHCDVRNCIEPEHLYEGSHRDNMRDRINRSRGYRGKDNGRAVLDEADVRIIRTSQSSGADLARQFGVTPTTICSIRKRRLWSHVP